MRTISGIDAKTVELKAFLDGNSSYDCLVVVSKDETEDIEIANDIIRSIGPDAQFNIILCVGADAPIFIVPRTGIAIRSMTLLIVDGVPPIWKEKENCICFEASLDATIDESLVKVAKHDYSGSM